MREKTKFCMAGVRISSPNWCDAYLVNSNCRCEDEHSGLFPFWFWSFETLIAFRQWCKGMHFQRYDRYSQMVFPSLAVPSPVCFFFLLLHLAFSVFALFAFTINSLIPPLHKGHSTADEAIQELMRRHRRRCIARGSASPTLASSSPFWRVSLTKNQLSALCLP